MNAAKSHKGREYMRLAHAYVTTAIYHGALPKLDGSISCKDCGESAEEYDHRDYMFPLKVEPVCMSCNQIRGPGKNIGPCEGAERRQTLLQRFREKHGHSPGRSARAEAAEAKERRITVLRLHIKGERHDAIARAVGVTRRRVSQIVREAMG